MMLQTQVRCTLLFLGLFMAVPFLLSAASESFTVGQSIQQTDFDPPTIPGNLTATPITTSQIDLGWDASSDNVGVAGYQIFRDAAAIATTTLTSYSDAGLSPSTTYAYEVRAFDAELNYSTNTPSVATTTFAPAPTATPTAATVGGGDITGRELELSDLNYTVGTNVIDLLFVTNQYARAVVRWGRTISYEGGFITSDIFRREHGTRIEGLAPDTLYELSITVTSRNGLREHTETLQVRTAAGMDTEPPANVSDLSATLDGDTVTLTWQNPSDEDFSHVRVLSNDRFYPVHTQDGWFVYEGDEPRVVDDRPLLDDARRYYAVFAYDEAGNISSGAVAEITRGDTAGPVPGIAPDRQPPTATETEPIFTFADLQFVQDGETQQPVDGEVVLDGDAATTISLAYELLPEHLKTIVVSLAHPDDPERVFSFLLRINGAKTAYEARIGPLRESGRYTTEVSLVDHATQELFTASGTVIVKVSPLSSVLRTARDGGMRDLALAAERYLLPVALAGLFLFIVLVWFVRRRRAAAREDSPLQFR